ncbi:MAG: hypothetical protein KDB80_01765 [Planctomycetes bacterium]|nr:hypothetical protein [Planctomycetota bacterium]
MIRASIVSALALCAAGCSSLPGLDFPTLTVRPQYHLMRLRGEIAMQSAPMNTLPASDNPAIPVNEFGQTKRDDDYGGVLAYGDGFSGLEFGYLNIDMDTTDRGTLSQDFGELDAGTIVTSKFTLEQFQISYVGQVYEYESDSDWMLRLGVGAKLTHRDGKISVVEDGTDMNQIATFTDDGVPYALARARVDHGPFSVTGDYAYTATTFGGDFDGSMSDYSVYVGYQLEDQDLRIFGGYRWIEMPVSGIENPWKYDADLKLEGYVLGVEFGF